MKRLFLLSAVILLLAGPSCNSSSDTAEYCPEACAIWSTCTLWDNDACMAECEADGDWDASYVACLRGQNCVNLEACG